MVKAVIFDIDNTLYSFSYAHDWAMKALCDYCQRELNLSPEDFRAASTRAMLRQKTGNEESVCWHSRCVRFQLVMEEYGLPLRYAGILNELYWNTLLDHIVPSPGVIDTVHALRARGIRLGVASDMTLDWQLKKLHRLTLLDDFHFLVTSEEAGVEKPHPRLFQICIQKAGCLPEECLMIGDNLKKDILGAQRAGMHALWFQPDRQQAALSPDVKSIPTFQGLIEHII